VQPFYGVLRKKPTHCKAHATPAMTDVVNKQCTYSSCSVGPSYGVEAGKPTHCKAHAEAGMTDVKSKHCVHVNCSVRPSYGLIAKTPTHCKAHALPTMSNVKHPQCAHPNCTVIPSYGIEANRPTHCKAHAEPTMSNVRDKQCDHEGCTRQNPNYGIPGQVATHCKTHHTEGMLLIKHRRCQFKKCKQVPLYGILHASHCDDHKLSTHVNLVEAKCGSCNLLQVLNADQLCMYCVPGTVDRARLAKQREIQGFLDAHPALCNYLLSDRRFSVPELGAGCTTKTRPDFIWDCGTHFVVLEIDEHQHCGYAEECDCARMINMGEDMMRRGIFIRYNPDGFKAEGRKMNVNWSRRTDLLAKWLTAAFERTESENTLEIVRLYFDDFSVESTTFEKIR
jgi:EsV-1-7 cysteine-rich motif